MLFKYSENTAIIHDWFLKDCFGGSEKIFQQIESLLIANKINYEKYSIACFLNDKSLKKKDYFHTSFIQNLPFSKKHFHKYFPLFPLAIEQFDLSKYKLILSSSHSFAKGVLTSPDQLHISYIHSPMRYAWDQMNIYLNNSSYKKYQINFLLRFFLHNLRQWDYISSTRIEKLIANSNYTSKRIKKYWGRESTVIHPPVETKNFSPKKNRGDFYLIVSRLVPNKRLDILIKAFNTLNYPLIIVGEGPEKKIIKKIANKNIKFLGLIDNNQTKNLMEECRAFVYAGVEDFGIAPVEAMAAGAPIIAYGKAGILETVNCLTSDSNYPTGLIYKDPSYQSLRDCVNFFEEKKIWRSLSSANIHNWSQKFNSDNFRTKFSSFLEKSLAEFS